MLSGLRSSVSKFIRERKADWAKRQLESELTSIINLMEGHKAADLPPGHKYYSLLAERAMNAVNKYRTRMGELGLDVPSLDEIHTSVPMLRELESMASGAGKESKVPMVLVGGAIITFLTGLGVTATLGLYHNLYVYITHFVH